jgi:RimJ/RimL family protein N-acetyltransferase
MDGGAIRTDRLTLRPLRPEDAPAIARGIADWEVMRWLTSPPWPYRLADAEAFVASPMSAGAMGIELAHGIAGVVHIARDGELGYWLARPFHGRGLMSEAAGALVAAHFAGGGRGLLSGYLPGNAGSRRVLKKLGFRPDGSALRVHRALGREVTVERVRLDLAARRDG